ncbi:MAG TPA: putative Ig domain-containing protein [Puia sp.]|jgi:hypothetical protein
MKRSPVAALRLFLASALFLLSAACLSAQDIPLSGKWKFSTGDQAIWAQPKFNDSSWAAIAVGAPWERQGYKGYDGFAWYRLHVVIPSSIREHSFLKERLRFNLGKIDDGDQVYLNGVLIGQNAGSPGTIEAGQWQAERVYTLNIDDRRILWNKENVIAVRVYDHAGNGGMYEGPYGISVADVTDFITLDIGDPFHFNGPRQLSKKIILQSTSEKYDFTGKLNIRVTDPLSGTVVLKQTIGTDFAHDRPFEYLYKTTLPENKAYEVTYDFTEGRSGKVISTTEYIPYILTPAPSPLPRINGPEVYGVRPSAPFLYKIPATGQKPLEYTATGLPAGLKLDSHTGIITGSIAKKGSYPLQLTVKNKSGIGRRSFTIQCGPTIGLTPALGWNSWNCWGLSVSDEKVRQSAAAMAAQLSDHGWTYINIDDGWEDKRDAAGEVLPNNKFPDMKGLAGYVHSLGLKIGIYSSPGPRTCGGYLGSYQHEIQDAASYARWGIDYLKYDWCSYGEIAPKSPGLDDYKKPYIVMRDALDRTGRDILYSLCQYGWGAVWKWGGGIGANSWRTTGDIEDNWKSLSTIGFQQDKAAPYTAPGNFNDPDMLVVGRVGWGPSLHATRLTPDEQYTHISLWALLAAPLLIGCDMSKLDPFTLGLLTNDEVLAVDQDALASPAVKAWSKENIQIWTRTLKSGAKAIGIFNLDNKPARVTVPLSEIGLQKEQRLRDLWRQKDLGVHTKEYNATIPAHGVLLLSARTIAH